MTLIVATHTTNNSWVMANSHLSIIQVKSYQHNPEKGKTALHGKMSNPKWGSGFDKTTTIN